MDFQDWLEDMVIPRRIVTIKEPNSLSYAGKTSGHLTGEINKS